MKKIDLPKATSLIESAPSLHMLGADARLTYSVEERGKEYCTNILFQTVYGFLYTECEYVNTIEYCFGLVEIENSKWKNEFLDAWIMRERPIEDAFGGESFQVKHYRVYFDEYGMYDILCKNLKIESE
jgi:hypothetical protein